MDQLSFQNDFTNYISSMKEICDSAGLSVDAGSSAIDFQQVTQDQINNFYQGSPEMYVKILQEFMDLKGEPTNTKTTTEFALKRMKISCSPIILNKITETDVVEVYSFDARQVFRSLNFLQYSSYSLKELSTGGWMQLFKRDQECLAKIWGTAQRILAGSIRYTENVCEPHIVSETSSPKMVQVKVQYKFMAATEDEAGRTGVIVCCNFDGPLP